MVQRRETKDINKLCVCEILRLSLVCGAYFFEFRGRNLVCFDIAYNFNGKSAPEAGKARMRTAFLTCVYNYCSWEKTRRFFQIFFFSFFSHTCSIHPVPLHGSLHIHQ